jgi:hypothetical protein
LERFDVVLFDFGLAVSYPGTSIDKLPLVHPQRGNTAQVDQTHVDETETKIPSVDLVF